MLDLRYLLEWSITSKPWALWSSSKFKPNTKHLFRNNLQMQSPNKPDSQAPKDVKTSVKDGMRVVRIILIAGAHKIEDWAQRLCSYLSQPPPGDTLHVIFDVYTNTYDYSQGRPVTGKRRFFFNLSQKFVNGIVFCQLVLTKGN